MKNFITKTAAVACILTVFGSLTAFSTETTVPQNTIGQTHIIELNNAINHECGAYCEYRYDAWNTHMWGITNIGTSCRYRDRTVHSICRYCGKEVGSFKQIQRQDGSWGFGQIRIKGDWYFIEPF